MKPLLVSIHIPKTAGISFSEILKRAFGEKMLFVIACDSCGSYLFDSEREAVPKALLTPCESHRRPSADLTDLIREKRIECLHGHVQPARIYPHFPRARYAVWLRHPAQRTVSHYEFFLRHPELSPLWRASTRKICEERNFPAFARELGNMQSSYLRAFPLRRFSFVGIMEDMENEARRFGSRFGITVESVPRINANPAKRGSDYELDAETRSLLEAANAEDLKLYAQAQRLRGKEMSFARRLRRWIDGQSVAWSRHG